MLCKGPENIMLLTPQISTKYKSTLERFCPLSIIRINPIHFILNMISISL